MDPVGITNASTRKPRNTNARMKAMTSDSRVSLMFSVWSVADRGSVVAGLMALTGGAYAATAADVDTSLFPYKNFEVDAVKFKPGNPSMKKTPTSMKKSQRVFTDMLRCNG